VSCSAVGCRVEYSPLKFDLQRRCGKVLCRVVSCGVVACYDVRCGDVQ